jgi:acyl-CoA thioesterase-1
MEGHPGVARTALTALLLALAACGPNLSHVRNLDRAAGRNIIAFGDSITEGFGVGREQAWPGVLSGLIGRPVLNAGVSGDTTQSALARLEKDVLDREPGIVIVGLGGNDFLRQVPKEETERNLREIVTRIQGKDAVVVLLGMDLGMFVDEYKDLYARVARDTGVLLIPQVLEGVLDTPRNRQEDRIHPNETGQRVLGRKIAGAMKPLLREAARSHP